MMILAADDIPLEGDAKLFYFFCATGGAIVGWCFEYFRNRLEIQKLRAEIVSLTGETLKNLQEARRTYTQTCSTCTDCATALIKGITGNEPIEELRNYREAFCKALLEETIPAYHSYTEWKHLQLSGSPKEIKDFLFDDVVAELRRFYGWLRVINRVELVRELNQHPAVVAKNSITPFYQLTKGLSGQDLSFADEQLKRIGNELIEAGGTDN